MSYRIHTQTLVQVAGACAALLMFPALVFAGGGDSTGSSGSGTNIERSRVTGTYSSYAEAASAAQLDRELTNSFSGYSAYNSTSVTNNMNGTYTSSITNNRYDGGGGGGGSLGTIRTGGGSYSNPGNVVPGRGTVEPITPNDGAGASCWVPLPSKTPYSCTALCATVGGTPTENDYGSRCVSGERRITEALRELGSKIFKWGCWKNCEPGGNFPTYSYNGGYCYEMGQKKDSDRTDYTVACYCSVPDASLCPVPPTSSCSDGTDNDGDGYIDSADPGCWSDYTDPSTYNAQSTGESNSVYACNDGIDNDGDTLADSADPGCWTDQSNPSTYNPRGTSEANIFADPRIEVSRAIVRQGTDVTVRWYPEFNPGCTLSTNLTGDASVDGSDTVTVYSLTMFSISCAGDKSDTVTVQVLPSVYEN